MNIEGVVKRASDWRLLGAITGITLPVMMMSAGMLEPDSGKTPRNAHSTRKTTNHVGAGLERPKTYMKISFILKIQIKYLYNFFRRNEHTK